MMEIVSNFMNSVHLESVAKSTTRNRNNTRYPTATRNRTTLRHGTATCNRSTLRRPTTVRHAAATRHSTTTRHPEFISGSISAGKILNQVQHDEGVILKQVQHDECGEIMYDLVNTVRPEPVEGQGSVVHASTSSARTAKLLDQKRFTDLVEGQVMRSYHDSLGVILKQVQHDEDVILNQVPHDSNRLPNQVPHDGGDRS